MKTILLSIILFNFIFTINSCYVGYGEPCSGENRGEFLLKDANKLPEIGNLIFKRTLKNGFSDSVVFSMLQMDTILRILTDDEIIQYHVANCQNYVESRRYTFDCDSSFEFLLLVNPYKTPPFELEINYRNKWGYQGQGLKYFEYESSSYYGTEGWTASSDECFIEFHNDSGMVKFFHKTDSTTLKRIR